MRMGMQGLWYHSHRAPAPADLRSSQSDAALRCHTRTWPRAISAHLCPTFGKVANFPAPLKLTGAGVGLGVGLGGEGLGGVGGGRGGERADETSITPAGTVF